MDQNGQHVRRVIIKEGRDVIGAAIHETVQLSEPDSVEENFSSPVHSFEQDPLSQTLGESVGRNRCPIPDIPGIFLLIHLPRIVSEIRIRFKAGLHKRGEHGSRHNCLEP